jgi:putative transposase
MPGQTCYVTSTCLDFAHLMHRNEMRHRMSKLILKSCLINRAKLHSFVVMSHHIHLLATPNEEQNISQLMRSFKSFSAKDMLPNLNSYELNQLLAQNGLNRRSFWKVSFRGLPVSSQKVFEQKVNYIHQNPVRAKYVEVSSKYPWSSSQLYQLELFNEERTIRLDAAIQHFDNLKF